MSAMVAPFSVSAQSVARGERRSRESAAATDLDPTRGALAVRPEAHDLAGRTG